MNRVTPELLRQNPLPVPAEGDKESRGRVLVIGGAREVPGAVRLAGEAALRAGAGKLQIATCQSARAAMGVLVPEARVIPLEETPEGDLAPENAERLSRHVRSAQAVLIGPGLLPGDATDALTAGVLAPLDGPAVIDAGALGCLPGLAGSLARHAGRLVITPHAGEMAHLLGRERDAIEADPAAAARELGARLHCVVVMKGARTHIVSPQGEAWLFQGGTVGLATSGSGDALSGIIAGLLARGTVPVWAAIWGVFVHGEAGTRLVRRDGGIGFLAREIAGEVSRVMGELSSGNG